MHQRLNKLLIQGKTADTREFSGGEFYPLESGTYQTHDRLRYVREIREIIEEEKGKIKDKHKNGAGGIEITTAYTKLIDDLIIKIYDVITDDCRRRGLCVSPSFSLIALGGYGRGELNPSSDIDILFLYDRAVDGSIEFAAHNIVPILCDIGFNLGHSVRALNDCISIAKSDITARTAMMESRYLAGNKEIFERFFNSFRRDVIKKGVDDFIKLKQEETAQRHAMYGNTICVSEPNIKEGHGGLRDFHTALWVSMAKFEINKLEGLERRGIIDEHEKNDVLMSLDFILRVRNDMHFLSEKKNDILSHEIQESVSKNLGYSNNGGTRGISLFMKDYYIHTSQIYRFSNSLIERCLRYKPGLLKRIFYLKTKELGDGFISINNEIHAKDFNHEIFKKNPLLLLKVFLYCQDYNLKLSDSINKMISSSLSLIADGFIKQQESNRIFCQILKGRELSRILRMMHDSGILKRFFAEFEDITFFSNCDLYHKFTVDEHTLRSLKYLEELSEAGDEETNMRKIYKAVSDKTVLKVATFLHDIGKGDTTGHIQRGTDIASAVLKRWGMEDISDTVVLLIRNHLLMSQIAQRRDMHDNKAIAEFCNRIKNIENLKMLYLLTYADLRSVGMDVWTSWKSALIWELYVRAYEYFNRSEEGGITDRIEIDKKKKEVLALLDNVIDRDIASKYFLSMPGKYILATSPEKIIKHIKLSEELDGKKLVIKYFHNMEVGYTELMVCTTGRAGLFSKIAGTLTSKNIDILGAQIYTRLDEIAIDTLQVSTVDGQPLLDEGMIQRFEQDLLNVLEGKTTVDELLSARQKLNTVHEKGGFRTSTKVEIDNSFSDTHTIIEVITMDRLGVLYDITRTLFNLGLNIYIAKISTEGRTAIDVFYVTEIMGGKISDEKKLDDIRKKLLEVV